MKLLSRRAAAILLVAALSLAPLAYAGPRRDRDVDLPERIVRIVKKIHKFFSGVTTHEDDNQPTPPKP